MYKVGTGRDAEERVGVAVNDLSPGICELGGSTG
jgi:hypothetical protein